tara:strand:- start:2301 stop:3467 length:1167 start_codon:yes stop_codon:yes gene_type:complete
MKIHLAISVLLLAGCTSSDFVAIATGKNPSATLERIANQKLKSYQVNPAALRRDIELARANYKKLLTLLRGDVATQWGTKEVVTPGNHRYVKYTDNYKSRAIVQFDEGLIVVETLDQLNPSESLRQAIITTLLTPDDPRSVDLYSAKKVRLTGKPYLSGLVRDGANRLINTPSRAEAYARYLTERQSKNRNVDKDSGQETIHYVIFNMVSDHQNLRATRYEQPVSKYAEQFSVSNSLIYAIMKTESSFNPFAVSSAPAYGLMQIVPTTAGRDSFKLVNGYEHTPSKEYLFNSDNNIELGIAYLHILDSRYLAKINNPVSREYCTIAAYNGGAGSVLKLFSRDRKQATDIINSLSSNDVYLKLRDHHPRNETRQYLVNVLAARKDFVQL